MLPGSFKEALELYAAGTPEKAFCLFSETGRSLDYKELYAAVNKAMNLLEEAGVGPGIRVAVHLPLSPQLVIYLLAVICSGAVAVPLGYSLPQTVFDSMVRILDPLLVIGLPGKVPHEESPVIQSRLTRRPGPSTGLSHLSGEPSLGVFTSGSTSQPKCVLLTEANLLAGGAFVIEAHAVTTADIVVCCMPLSHINGIVTTVLTPLLTGSTVIFLEGAFTPRAFLACMRRYRATWFSAAPVHYQLLLYPGETPSALDPCRFGRSASAGLNPVVQRRIEDLYGIPIIQTLGLTECSGQVFSNPMPPGVRKAGSVGRPIGNEVEIVDADGLRAPVGAIGEIRVRGPNVMLGYFDDPKTSAETLRGGWLYTGDLAFRDSEGYFFITGRKKLVAIIGGENVSLLAVEEAARSVCFVEDAAAVARESPVTGEVIDLYYTSSGGEADQDMQKLRQRLLAILPHHHALGAIKRLESLPRSESGKILRSKLTHESGSDQHI